MSVSRVSFCLILLTQVLCPVRNYAQETAALDTTNAFPARPTLETDGATAGANPRIEIQASPYPNEEDYLKLEFLGDYRRVANGGYESLSSGGLALLIAATDQESVGLSLELGVVQLARGSLASDNLTDPRFLQTGLVFRHYFTPSHVFLRPYATVNANYFWMMWDYRTPIELSDGTSIGRDFVEGMDISASVGLALRLHRHVNLFGEFTGGGVAVLPETEAGLDNNLLGSFGYVGVKAGFSVIF